MHALRDKYCNYRRYYCHCHRFNDERYLCNYGVYIVHDTGNGMCNTLFKCKVSKGR